MPNFTGTLRSNEIFSALYNMIISQRVYADNIAGTNSTLVDEARTDGGLYGDKKLYYASDVLKAKEWGGDAEAANLLQIDRPPMPKCQEVILDQFKMIPLTLDNYLSKRAWEGEGAFFEFNSVMLAWMANTKAVIDSTSYNAFFGTKEVTGQIKTFTVAAGTEAQDIATQLADLIDDLEDTTRNYNDYKFLRSHSSESLKVVWNAKYVNRITFKDTPTIYNDERLMKMLTKYKLPSRFFGTLKSSGGQSTGVERTMVEMDFNTVKLSDKNYKPELHIFPGDVIPSGKPFEANEAYTVDDNIICKIVTELPPFMSSFETGTSFFNPRSLTENHYLIWGHNTLEHLYGKPFITVKKSV